MTFEHQIDVDPATKGSAATALTAEHQAIVRKLLVAQAFAASAGSTTAIRYTAAAQLSGALWATPWPTPTARSALAQLQTTTHGDTCLW